MGISSRLYMIYMLSKYVKYIFLFTKVQREKAALSSIS